MWSVGLDNHLNRSSLHILDSHGALVKKHEVRGGWPRLVDEVKRVRDASPDGIAICFEASCSYGHLYEQLRPLARRVVVAHPAHLRWIYRSKKKNNPIDAEKLAKLLFLDQVPAVHVPATDVRAWRRLIAHRHRTVAMRVRSKNGLRALLRGLGIESPKGQRLWTNKGMLWLENLQLPSPQDAVMRDLLLQEVRSFDAQIKRVDRELNHIAEDHPGVSLLRTIPGVGPRTAEAVVAHIDDATRFARNKQIGAYFGIVPCEDSSGDVQRLGHITRQGPGYVRKLAVEAAWQAIRRSPSVKAFFERIKKNDKDRRKIALVATAHYLLRVMHAMLRSGEVWREKQEVKEG